MSGNQGTQDDVEQQEQLREQVEVDGPEQVKKQQESQQKQQASQRSAVGAKRTDRKDPTPSQEHRQ